MRGYKEIHNGMDIIDSRQIIDRIDYLAPDLESAHETYLSQLSTAYNPMEQEKFDGGDPDRQEPLSLSDFIDAMADGREDIIELAETDLSEEAREWKLLSDLIEEIPDASDGRLLIRDGYFENYAMEYAEEIGAMPDTSTWPATCIDWEKAAEELQQDFSQVDFGGETYWFNS